MRGGIIREEQTNWWSNTKSSAKKAYIDIDIDVDIDIDIDIGVGIGIDIDL